MSGVCNLAIRLKGRICVVDVLIVPDLPHLSVFGWDFWKRIGIVPIVKEWHFMDQLPIVDVVEVGGSETFLSVYQQRLLQAVVDSNIALMGQSLDCTSVADHVIETNSPPIKQRYFRVSPVMQKAIDRELRDMLERAIIEKSDSPWASPLIMFR